MRDRIRRAVDLIGKNGFDGLWVEPSQNFTYLFGFESLSLERLCGVLVTASGNLRAVYR
jgi:Xaa-Pro aminopeptidase